MGKTTFRFLTCGAGVIGLVALVFLPPVLTTPAAANAAIPAHEMAIVAWCIAITGTVFGLGLGLFLGSFVKLKSRQQNKNIDDDAG